MTDSSAVVAAGKVVTLEYTLKDAEGKLLDQSGPGEPLDYLHGAHNIVPGLERKVQSRAVGDELDVVVDPIDGYGERQGEPQPVPRDAFPPDADLEEGTHFVAESEDGQMVPLWVVGVKDDEVIVDPNHPLAGMTLHFHVKVLAIRDATEEEKAHGHVHGPQGHAH